MKSWFTRLILFSLLAVLAGCGGQRVIKLSDDEGRLWGAVLAPDGASFIVIKDRTLEMRTWPAGKRLWRQEIRGYPNYGPAAAAFAPDSAEVAVGQEGRILFYAAADGSARGEIPFDDSVYYVPYLAYRVDGTFALLVGRGEDKTIMFLEIWDRQGVRLKESVQLSAHTTDWGQWQPFTPDGSRAAYVGQAHLLGAVDVAQQTQWEWDLSEPLHFDDRSNAMSIFAMAISPDGKEAAIGLSKRPDSTLQDIPLVMRVDVQTGQTIAAFSAPVDAGDLYKVDALAYSPDGRFLAVDLNVDLPHSALIVYNLESGSSNVLCNNEHGCCSHKPAFSPDGTTLVTFCDGQAAQWEIKP